MWTDKLTLNEIIIYSELFKILKSKDSYDIEKTQKNILNLISMAEKYNLKYFSDFINLLYKNYRLFGIRNELWINNKYNLSDEYGDYQNDASMLKLIFSKTLFMKLNSIENEEEKYELLNKVFDIAEKTNVAGYAILFLFKNLPDNFLENSSDSFKKLLIQNILSIIKTEKSRQIENNDDCYMIDVEAAVIFENLYKFDLKKQCTKDFFALVLNNVGLEIVKEIDESSDSLIDNILKVYGYKIDDIIENNFIVREKNNEIEEDTDINKYTVLTNFKEKSFNTVITKAYISKMLLNIYDKNNEKTFKLNKFLQNIKSRRTMLAKAKYSLKFKKKSKTNKRFR